MECLQRVHRDYLWPPPVPARGPHRARGAEVWVEPGSLEEGLRRGSQENLATCMDGLAGAACCLGARYVPTPPPMLHSSAACCDCCWLARARLPTQRPASSGCLACRHARILLPAPPVAAHLRRARTALVHTWCAVLCPGATSKHGGRWVVRLVLLLLVPALQVFESCPVSIVPQLTGKRGGSLAFDHDEHVTWVLQHRALRSSAQRAHAGCGRWLRADGGVLRPRRPPRPAGATSCWGRCWLPWCWGAGHQMTPG
jgi:hypothetical protein